MKSLIALLSITLLITACSQNTNKQEFAKAENASPAPVMTPKQSAAGMKLTKPTELLPEITEIYSAQSNLQGDAVDGTKLYDIYAKNFKGETIKINSLLK